MNNDEPFYMSDAWLKPFEKIINNRYEMALGMENRLSSGGSLRDCANSFLYYGLHKTNSGWIFREWAPNATEIFIIGPFNNWKQDERYRLHKTGGEGDWEITLPEEALHHEDLYKLLVKWNGGWGERIPSHANRQCRTTIQRFSPPRVWSPPPNISGETKSLFMKQLLPYIRSPRRNGDRVTEWGDTELRRKLYPE